jgi:nicotinamidase-related amidase
MPKQPGSLPMAAFRIVVVDTQVGFVNDYTREVPAMLDHLFNRVTFDQAIFTRFINTESSPFRTVLSWHELSNEAETQIVPGLLHHASAVIDKTTYIPDISRITALLSDSSVQHVYVAGIDTDVCVLLTAAALFDAGYGVKILADCSMSTAGPRYHHSALNILGRIIGSKNIITDSTQHFESTRMSCHD